MLSEPRRPNGWGEYGVSITAIALAFHTITAVSSYDNERGKLL